MWSRLMLESVGEPWFCLKRLLTFGDSWNAGFLVLLLLGLEIGVVMELMSRLEKMVERYGTLKYGNC